MPRQSACANRSGVSSRRFSASGPMLVVSASMLALLAGGTSALAQGRPPTGPGDVPAPIVAPSGAPTAPAADAFGAGGPGLNSVIEPTAGFPEAGDDRAARPPTSEPKEDSQVKVDDNLVVDLHVNDEELSNVLQMLSIQSQRNIVASNSVNARVKADLYGVTFYEALDAILHVNGYGYIDRGNFIYVYTLEELQQIEQAARVRVSKVIKLNYLNAIDAAEFVKPLLSDGAQIKTNGKTKDFAINNVPMGADEFAHDATLVVYDYEENLAEIEKLVKELDTRPAQVLIEATILQTQLNEANAFGVDFALIADLNFVDFATLGGPESVVNNLITGRVAPEDDQGGGIVSSPGNTVGRSTMKLGLIANDVAAFVKLLDETSDTTIISNPKVLALNRAQTRVLVGRKVGYLSTTSTDTTTTQSVEFLDTGTQLTVRPFVSADGMIRMELKPQVSEAVIRDTRDATGAAVTIPDEITNELNTNVMVRDGQTIVLGGLFRESTQATRRQVPFLGDIPLLGSAFRGNDDETNRSEIIFLITPSIVNDNVLLSQGEAARDYVERARAGSREGLLPWSREKMTSMGLVEAQKLASNGETQKALWKIQQSLTLNPNQPDAIAMREKLTNEKSTWPSRNLLDAIIHNEAATKAGMPQANAQLPTPVTTVAVPTAPAAPIVPPVVEPAPTPVTDATPSHEEPIDTQAEAVPSEPAPETTEAPGETPPDPQPETPGQPQAMATPEVSPASPFPESGLTDAAAIDTSGAVTTTTQSGWDPAWTAQNQTDATPAIAVSPAPVEDLVESPAGEPSVPSEAAVEQPPVDRVMTPETYVVPEVTDNAETNSANGTSSVTPEPSEITPLQPDAQSAESPREHGDAAAAPQEPTSDSTSTAAPSAHARSHDGGATNHESVNPPSVVNAAEDGITSNKTPAKAGRRSLSGASTAHRPPIDGASGRAARVPGQSQTTSPQTQNSQLASSDHHEGGTTARSGAKAESNAPAAVAEASVGDGSDPPVGLVQSTGGGSDPAPNPEEPRQRVATASRVLNRSWQLLRAFHPGWGQSAGAYTQAPTPEVGTSER